ncbi:DUF481 domain-containing protein [Candidatus Latescibacterota bacterium]
MRLFIFFTSTLLLCLVFISHVGAQVNIEKFRKAGDDERYSGYVELDFSSRTGNVDIKSIAIECRSNYRWRAMDTFMIVTGNYGWQGGKRYSNEALAHLRHVFRSGMLWQPEVFIQVDYNKKRLLSSRELFGGGFRCAVYKSTKNNLWYGTSIMLEHERYDLEENNSHDDIVAVARWSNYVTTTVNVNERTEFISTVYVQPCLRTFEDIRILGETDLKIELGEQLSFVMTFNLRYDSKPPDNIKVLDTEIKPGLVLNF